MPPLTKDVIQETIGLKKHTTDRHLVHLVGVLLILFQEMLLAVVKSLISIEKFTVQILVRRGQDLEIEGQSPKIENQALEDTLNQKSENQEDTGRSHENEGELW